MKQSEWETSEERSKINASGCLLSLTVIAFVALLGAAIVGVILR